MQDTKKRENASLRGELEKVRTDCMDLMIDNMSLQEQVSAAKWVTLVVVTMMMVLCVWLCLLCAWLVVVTMMMMTVYGCVCCVRGWWL